MWASVRQAIFMHYIAKTYLRFILTMWYPQYLCMHYLHYLFTGFRGGAHCLVASNPTLENLQTEFVRLFASCFDVPRDLDVCIPLAAT